MLAQPDQDCRTPLDSITPLRIFISQVAAFHFVNYSQFKSQRVIALRPFFPMVHVTLPKSVNVFQDGSRPKEKPPGANREAFLLQRLNYLAVIKATVVSSMRFEKPHSLSYHDETLTRRPDTLVRVESKFDEAGLWLKSIDTSGSV